MSHANTEGRRDGAEPIAIVGIGCRYADARGPAEFWEIVRSGRNTVRDAPDHRIELGYDIDHFYDPRPRIPGKISSKKGGFLEHPELFDPAAFGIAPRDALTMEPQQRLMVEVTWDALEDAGIVPESIAGERVAVMLGYMAEDYSRERGGVLGEEAVYRGHDVFTVGGMSHAVLSGRIAFLLGVMGPSFTLDTACSSSLITTHLACESLRRGESKMAIAGGVNLFLSPEGNIALSRSGMLSMSGACKAFDASADGFVRAEGAGVVVLRPLSDALDDGNPIYAVIRGSGISSDGRDGGHMMAPGRKGQAQAMRDAYAMSGIAPSDVHYVETHGTGTMIGDPVEIGALADVLGPGRDPERPLLVASVKGNLGHTESASGIAGLIKTALAIRHRELPAQLHFETPNPAIPWDEVPVRVVSESIDWPYAGPALAGVNSFGISGTNAHAILESPPEDALAISASSTPARATVIPLSGHEPMALFEMAEAQRDQLKSDQAPGFTDLGYTLARRRTHRAHRLAVVADSIEELQSELDSHLEGNATAAARTGHALGATAPRIVMIFPGQGGQWLGMGRELLDSEPVFGESIDRLDAAYARQVDWSLRSVLEGRAGIDWTKRLDVLQPVLIAVEVALAELWASWGIRPDRVIGQSLGEVAAAYIAGCLSLEDMALLACQRGKVVSRASGSGAMAIVSLARTDVEEAIRELSEAAVGDAMGRVEVAGSNGPTTTIVSGDRDAVLAMVDHFEARGVFARRLEVDFASHCFHMDPLLDDFHARIRGIEPRAGRVPFDSTVDGLEKSGQDLDAAYWVRNLREPVAFDVGLARSIEAGGQICLEVSPHPSLARPIKEIATAAGQTVDHVPSLQRLQDERRSLMTSLAALFVRGVEVDFGVLHPQGRVIQTPLYAYQRKRFWFSDRNRLHHFRPVHPLLGARSQSSLDPRLQTWDFMLDEDTAGFVGDHRVDGRVTAPSGLYPELALAAADALWPGQALAVSDFEMRHPLVLGDAGRRAMQVVARLDGEHRAELHFSTRPAQGSDWTLHATCRLRPRRAICEDRIEYPQTLDREGNESLASAAHFETLEDCGITLGSRMRTLRELERAESEGDDETIRVAHLMLPRSVESEWHAYHAHPSIVETALQLVAARLAEPAAVRVSSIGEIELEGGLGSECWARITCRPASSDPDTANDVEASIELFDREGRRIGHISRVRARALPRQGNKAANSARGLHRIEWRAIAPPATLAGGEVGGEVGGEAGREPLQREIDHWLIVSDSAAEAGLMTAELQKHGAICRFSEKIEDLERLAQIMQIESAGRWGFALIAWGGGEGLAESEPLPHRAFRVGTWANAIREHCALASQVWIATRGLQPVDDRPSSSAPTSALVAHEIETFATCAEMQQCRLFDASQALAHRERVQLASLMGHAGDERQFIARDGEIRVPRLVEVHTTETGSATAQARRAAGDRNFRALHSGREGAGCLVLREAEEAVVLPGSVVVEVGHAALSQLDVLAGLGLSRRGDPESAGVALEFSGVVRAVADPSCALRVGDAVIGVHAGALARRIVVPTTHVAPKPEFWSGAEAAALPFSFVVARYALEVVGRLRAGERILILSAGGGIGHALVQVARSVGAEVTVTAGSPEKLAALRELGVDVLGNAREDGTASSSIFAGAELGQVGDVREVGEFDVIVGSGAGIAMHRMLERLASGGRYLDLCPRDRFERPELGSLRIAPNRSVSAIDALEMITSDPLLVDALLEQTVADAARGRIHPVPTTVFAASQAARALRSMAQNRHLGRVCVDLTQASEVRIESQAGDAEALRGRGTFVLVGDEIECIDGVRQWLSERGADEVVVRAPGATDREGAERPPERLAGWIQITGDDASASSDTDSALVSSPAAFAARISLRDRSAVGSASERAWESRLWVDRLLLAGRWQAGRSLCLSVDRENAEGEILRVLGQELLSVGTDPQLVHFDSAELADRIAGSTSPLLSLLERKSAESQQGQILRGELSSMSPPERRAAMARFVRDTLASVLSLSEKQRESLVLESPLDAVGLDSLMTMELFMSLGRDLELEIGADWFGTAPTLSGIADVLADRIGEAGGDAGGA